MGDLCKLLINLWKQDAAQHVRWKNNTYLYPKLCRVVTTRDLKVAELASNLNVFLWLDDARASYSISRARSSRTLRRKFSGMEASGIDQREVCSLRHSPGEDQGALERAEAGSTQVVSTSGNASGSSRGGGVSLGSPRDVHRSQARSFASSYFDGNVRSGFSAKQRLPSDTRNAYAEMRKVYTNGQTGLRLLQQRIQEVKIGLAHKRVCGQNWRGQQGVWPESERFSERWKGTCETGEQFHSSHCNKCQILLSWPGPEAYAKANQEALQKVELQTHVSQSTRYAGETSRPAPYGHILSAFDMGIHDGVDIISASLGGSAGDYFLDSTSIGAFHAMQKGIVVVASAGNEGPGSVGNGSSFTRQRLSKRWYHLAAGADVALQTSNFPARQCMSGSLDPKEVRGKIVACLRRPHVPLREVSQADGAGIIVCNSTEDPGNEILSSVHVDERVGQAIFSYIKSTRDPEKPKTCSFHGGPNSVDPDILSFTTLTSKNPPPCQIWSSHCFCLQQQGGFCMPRSVQLCQRV
ncbi:hypothetical protein SELMODRAFT_417798 [Selaginella moellendorffii]|uniref:Peptidase S8/S53 domain-containing protein n=1 Tax=Selaginella moellendorffii TaxID=88036 RepID=D8S3N2_SELML|nr:hypothetical protein SELMODRAFT_417798 [Selaginella moellendorffii]